LGDELFIFDKLPKVIEIEEELVFLEVK